MATSTSHYAAPTGSERRLNSLMRWFADRGVGLAGARTLEVAGRKSGREQRVVVNPLTLGDREFVVSPRGHTHWVRNVRVTPSARIVAGKRAREVVLTEINAGNDRVTVLREYLRRWGWEVGRFLPAPVTAKSTDAELAAVIEMVPIFEVHRR